MFLNQFKSTQPVPTKLFWGRKQVESDVLISETFNQYFASVYQVSESSPSAGGSLADSEIKLSEVDVSPSIIGELLAKCKETRSTDNIPAFIYKSCHSILSPLVSFLFLSIIQSCVWPDSWKTAFITPVFKYGYPYDITNYRPVSKLPPLSLIFERIFFNYIYPQVRYKISNAQHGFRKKRSTITQMFSYLDEVNHTHDAKIPCAAMYFDFSKAFDSVRHDIIVQKFAAFGFDDIFTTLLISYLSNCFQCVKFEQAFPPLYQLLVVYLKGAYWVFCFSFCLLMIFLIYSIIQTVFFSLMTQNSFVRQIAVIYSLMWTVSLNGVLRMVLRSIKTSAISLYSMENFLIVFLLTTNLFNLLIYSKTFGLLVSSDLTWSDHISKKLLSSNKSFHFIKRSIPYHIPLSVKLMFINTCVKSILLNASPVWSPSLTMLRKLENFNRKGLTWVTGHLSYLKQLSLTNSLPISFTLIFNDLILFHKMLNGYSELPFAVLFF